MTKQLRRTLLSALLVVPFMLGNRSCEGKSQSSQPEGDEGSLDDGSARGDERTEIARDDADADASTTNATEHDAGTGGKLPTCEAIDCGALPSAPSCTNGDAAFPSCVLNNEGGCAWRFSCGGVDGPDTESGSGEFCGGLLGVQCKAGHYCHFGSSCGASDQGGKCAKITESCSFEYNPVCGCDVTHPWPTYGAVPVVLPTVGAGGAYGQARQAGAGSRPSVDAVAGARGAGDIAGVEALGAERGRVRA